MLSRRSFVGVLPAGLVLPAYSGLPEGARLPEGVQSSPLIYVSPLRSNGSESRCQGEVWFQAHDGALYVVTASSAWRARCIGKGMNRARVWIGDVGMWRSSDGAYRALPQVELSASVNSDAAVQAAVLAKMGAKYAAEWRTWGPRFRDGLADGSRVMLEYR